MFCYQKENESYVYTRDLQKVSALLYFQRKWKEQEGWGGVAGGIVGCHVTSRHSQPVDLAVSVRVAMKQ
jgi:hypothetical protein